VDPSLHWANPPGGLTGRDTRPTFADTPGAYIGPVPIVTHVHGAVGVGDESDGYAEAWYLPAANNIPTGYATNGAWYDFFAGKAAATFGVDWGPGFATFQYPNHNRASTIWYHDHALGMTRLNVYAGPAGFYIIRGGPGDVVLDTRTGAMAVLPGPAPKENDKFPPNKTYYEIPLAIQDRSFNSDGSLFYPDSRAFFDGIIGPYVPDTDISPIWNPEFFGNTIMVNGNTWPFQVVEQRR
jgi:spore coat protein A